MKLNHILRKKRKKERKKERKHYCNDKRWRKIRSHLCWRVDAFEKCWEKKKKKFDFLPEHNSRLILKLSNWFYNFNPTSCCVYFIFKFIINLGHCRQPSDKPWHCSDAANTRPEKSSMFGRLWAVRYKLIGIKWVHQLQFGGIRWLLI